MYKRQPVVNENYKQSYSDGEKLKWSRPKHSIEANIRATKNAKEKRKLNQKS